MTVDPGSILGDPSVHAWIIRQSAAAAETHDPRLDPAIVLLDHQRASGIPLGKSIIK